MKRKKDILSITIGWLYPELMSTYGDRGNLLVLQRRCSKRDIECRIQPIDFQSQERDMKTLDFVFGGGAQDRQQGILIEDLRKRKGHVLRELLEKNIPGLFVCGSPQLLGHVYMTGDGKKLDGLGLFNMESRHFGNDTPRCIGNTIISISDRYKIPGLPYRNTVVGFENHGGRTYLGNGVKPFGTVVVGKGNNGEDKTEGAVFRNWIATYSHGPLLSKNPHIADFLIAKSLEVKYQKSIKLKELDDTLMWKAHDSMLGRLGV